MLLRLDQYIPARALSPACRQCSLAPGIPVKISPVSFLKAFPVCGFYRFAHQPLPRASGGGGRLMSKCVWVGVLVRVSSLGSWHFFFSLSDSNFPKKKDSGAALAPLSDIRYPKCLLRSSATPSASWSPYFCLFVV